MNTSRELTRFKDYSRFTREFSIIEQAIGTAIQRIRQLSYEGLIIHTKPDGSPVTNADLEVDRILREAVLQAFPKDGWLSEEFPDNPKRLRQQRVWVLDPIDGTRPFTKGLPQYTISLALLEYGQPVLGVIINPATQEYFSAVIGEGAHLNGREIRLSATLTAPPTFIINPTSVKKQTLNRWMTSVKCPMLLGSIAYSLALVTTGHADGLISLGHQYEWDIAAGALLIKEAGGFILDRQYQPISWNQPQPVIAGIVATHSKALPLIQDMLQPVP
jgi:myo-inositol-1(or 4)-monophosphatase